ncbi:protein phosphatase 2C domain-containing protein [Oceanobacillus sp. E9]|uniref:protein phosphatase 2C domain-containing protein n=1 Tax=Oceanobacillus sp. E9 TaxID=1742575 RepID=UPI000ADCDC5C|nr:protein phosphatase 2C domain-containing protein [Oceanobacillus sp. E9]
MNQRQFFEWIGQMNTFNQEVPCYSTGVRELRKGENHIFLCTDGLIECPHAPFAHPERIFNLFSESAQQDTEIILSMLETLQSKEVKDSTTIISWKVLNSKNVSMPSDELN